jgi:hypothetical protein
MELSSQESIHALMRAKGFEPQGEKRRGPQRATWPASQSRRVGCKCGQCRQCLDNARWERIFARKFADPDYYTTRRVRYSSPLTSL